MRPPPSLCSEELSPGRARPPRRRPKAGTPKNPTDRARAHADPELAKLALDPDAAPPRVLPTEACDQLDGLRTQARSPGTSPTVGPLPPHALTMPAKEGLRRDHERGPTVAGQRPARRGEERPIVVLELGAAHRAAKNSYLVAKNGVLELELRHAPTCSE
jgi:hypothetical protein